MSFYDHVRLRQHQVAAVACIVVGIGFRHIEHAGTTKSGGLWAARLGGGELSRGSGSTKVIRNGCSYANGKVLVDQSLGDPLQPAAARRRRLDPYLKAVLIWGWPTARPRPGSRITA
jgi:hypothetical protein